MASMSRRWRASACRGAAAVAGLYESSAMNRVAVIAHTGRTSEMLFDALAIASRDAAVPDQ
jgi:hypothetical protein